ncbi:M4 family metallopeptidase [Planctomonas psychrotolerans]|uniref:M4 family metallopeptidase n=1 Tax=Planctomonas psychrotolerans TaxID=2528712 RepID=UPI00123910E9|nr:M4 family metallopeptidase [Planctomonas psychrotolerans]
MRHYILPPYLLQHLATAADTRLPAVAEAARAALRDDEPVHSGRAARQEAEDSGRAAPGMATRTPRGPQRTIFDAGQAEELPGRRVRGEGEPENGDAAVTEAYDGLGATYAMFADAFGRASIDGAELPLDATVHYGHRYENAFWDGSRMVFGDGDGEIFHGFTKSITVLGHELSHGVIQHTTNLTYSGESGALNESIADVFGVLVEQHLHRQEASSASWLVGAELFTDSVEGVALRSMKAPGTAYDDDLLGRDPQPAHMTSFVVTTEDYGGVHINSGIPNRAFCLAAEEIGGFAWQGAGRIWYDTIVRGDLAPTTDFVTFASATVTAAHARFGAASRERAAVASAWKTVGVQVTP